MTKLKPGDLVKIGRKKDVYRIKQIPLSGEGAALIETVDQTPYATTYVNAGQLKPAKAETSTTTPPPGTPSTDQGPGDYGFTLTTADGASYTIEIEGAESEAAAVDAVLQHPEYTQGDNIVTADNTTAAV